jgi:hypothetical protein
MNGKLAIASLTDVIFMGTYQLVMQHCSPSPIIDYSLIVTGNNISTLIVIRAHHLCTAYCRSQIFTPIPRPRLPIDRAGWDVCQMWNTSLNHVQLVS